MRAASLLPLALVTGLVTGCGTESPRVADQEVTAAADSMVERDLTLQASAAPSLEVASPVELNRHESAPATAPDPKPVHPTAPIPQPAPVSPEESAPSAPAMLRAAAPAKAPVGRMLVKPAPVERAEEEPAAQKSSAQEPGTPGLPAGAGRELAPGRTVTVIPAAGGPSIEADADDSWLPSERPHGIIGAGGGTCRPRGGVRGLGTAGRIPVGIPTRHLR